MNILFTVVLITASIVVLLNMAGLSGQVHSMLFPGTFLSPALTPALVVRNPGYRAAMPGTADRDILQVQKVYARLESNGIFQSYRDLPKSGGRSYESAVEPQQAVYQEERYETKSKVRRVDIDTDSPVIVREKRQVQFSPEQARNISTQLDRLMQTQKPFLQLGYSLGDLAKQLEIPAYQLSAYINMETGANFNELINKLRIAYCQEIIKLGEAEPLNLFGLGVKCGFSNRNTFTMAFKKFAGTTPSEFLRSCPRS